MAWETVNVMDQRKRFVLKALDPSSCMAELCREFGIARKTGYKWVKRFQEGGYGGLEDLSRRPRGSPSKTPAEVQLEILKLRLPAPALDLRSKLRTTRCHSLGQRLLGRNGASENSRTQGGKRLVEGAGHTVLGSLCVIGPRAQVSILSGSPLLLEIQEAGGPSSGDPDPLALEELRGPVGGTCQRLDGLLTPNCVEPEN